MGWLAWLAVSLVPVVIIAVLPALSYGKGRFYACYTCYLFFSAAISILTSPLLLFYYKDPAFLGINSTIVRHVSILLGIKWEVRNEEKLLKNKKGIIVSNHISVFDVLAMHVLHQYMGTFSSLSKKEVLYFFPWGPIAWLGGLIFVDRQSRKSKAQALKKAIDYLNRGVKIWFFAEGTRNNSHQKLLPFKKGAFQMAIDCQAVIIPVVISPYSFIDYDKKIFNKGKVILSVLDEISPEGMTRASIETLMNDTRLKMTQEFVRLSREVRAVQTNTS